MAVPVSWRKIYITSSERHLDQHNFLLACCYQFISLVRFATRHLHEIKRFHSQIKAILFLYFENRLSGFYNQTYVLL
jgi:hypothetical protein